MRCAFGQMRNLPNAPYNTRYSVKFTQHNSAHLCVIEFYRHRHKRGVEHKHKFFCPLLLFFNWQLLTVDSLASFLPSYEVWLSINLTVFSFTFLGESCYVTFIWFFCSETDIWWWCTMQLISVKLYVVIELCARRFFSPFGGDSFGSLKMRNPRRGGGQNLVLSKSHLITNILKTVSCSVTCQGELNISFKEALGQICWSY